MTYMTRSDLETLIWHRAPGLCSPHPECTDAMTAILAAVEDYAATRAEELAALRTTRVLAGYYAPDPAEVTARRRAELEAALSAHESGTPSEMARYGPDAA